MDAATARLGLLGLGGDVQLHAELLTGNALGLAFVGAVGREAFQGRMALDSLHHDGACLGSVSLVGRADSTKAEALAALPGADCDVLISDIGLADGTGWELLRRVQLIRSIYAIAMSGRGMEEDQVRSGEAGFHHHLLKPFSPAVLDRILGEAARHLQKIQR